MGNAVLGQLTVATIAETLNGAIHGDSTRTISGIKPLEQATISDLSFLAPTSKQSSSRLRDLAQVTRAGALLVSTFDPILPTTQIVVSNPLLALIQIIPLVYQAPEPSLGVHALAVLGQNVILGHAVSIGPLAVIGDNVSIGDHTVIHPHAVIYAGAKVGKHCVIHSGAVIREHVQLGDDCRIQNGVVVGGDGFGYIPDRELGHRRIPHIGTVVLENSVDLGANTTIDRATLGETRIGAGTKIDNLVMVGHNVSIGERSLLCSQVGISGSATVGKQVTLGGQVGVADHVHIGDSVRAAARTGISKSLRPNIDVAGFPPTEIRNWRREIAAARKLPEILERLAVLEKQDEKDS